MQVGDTERVYLSPGEYVDNDHGLVAARASELRRGAANDKDVVRRIFDYVRDLTYGAPDFDRLGSFKASDLIGRGRGYCVPKAAAFTALCRAAEVPARLGFADVSNHLASPKTLALMGGHSFAWHGCSEVFLGGRWLKASPTFDTPLCWRLGVSPLEFDGEQDAHLQPFDSLGRTFMSYDRAHGVFHDVPARFLAAEMPRLYPRAYQAIRAGEVD